MWSRLLRLLLSSAIAATLLVCLPKLAHAQATIAVYQETSLPRVDENNKTINKRGLQYNPEGVSYQDCVDNISISFPLQLSGFVGNATLSAYASLSGADCSTQTVRTGIARQCWPLVTGIALTTSQTVNIPVRTIMSGALDVANLNATASICGKVDLTTVGVQFLYFDPGNTAQASANHPVSVQVDTVGPAPPTGVKTLPGNGRITVQWDNISGEGGVSVLSGVKVYCDTSGATDFPNDTNGDAGPCAKARAERAAAAATPTCTTTNVTDDDGGDAGTVTKCEDGGTTTASRASTAACTSTNLIGTNIIPSANFDACFSCGSITGNTGNSVVADDIRGGKLINNTTYTLSVASTDAFNNVGPLSTIVCQYPEETNDFWENYKNAGGNAGGGCATTGDAPLGTIAGLGGTALIVGSLIRRRRRQKQ